MSAQTLLDCRAVHYTHRDRLIGRNDVVATGVGFRTRNGRLTDQHVIKVFVTRKVPAGLLYPEQHLPSVLTYGPNQVEIDVEEIDAPSVPPHHTGITVPQPADPQLATEQRPISGGYSISHYDFPIGTMGVGVLDLLGGWPCMLSCNHVLARMNQAHPGDAALQPGVADGGCYPAEAAGSLLRYVHVHMDGRPNWVDAAIAACRRGEVTNRVHGLGPITESAGPWTLSPGDAVTKVGRTTGLTQGTVFAVDVAVNPNYAKLGFANQTVLFVDQIMVDIKCGMGDSGSLLVDSRNRAVGLLFGGTKDHTWFNPFTAVETALSVSLLPPSHVWI
jgi:hypothetical protein